jgi:ketosteroid isomerase-like protein
VSANLDLVRSIYADWERGDFSRADWADPEIEFVLPHWPEAGTWSGLTGMATAWRGMASAWEDYRVAADEYHELDGERVLVINHASGRGRTSGLEVDQITTPSTEPGAMFHVQGGKVTRLVSYWGRNRALADLGLSAEEATLTPAEKLALGQRSYAACNAGPDIDALLPVWHPECEWRMGSVGPAVGTESLRGHDGFRAMVAAIEEGWESFTVEIDEARITGEGVVLARGHSRGRSRGTHMELSTPRFWQRSTYRDGLIFSVEQFDEPPPGRDEATPITPEAG